MKNFNYEQIQTKEKEEVQDIDFESPIFKLYHAIKNQSLSNQYKLKLSLNFFKKSSISIENKTTILKIINITNDVIEKYRGHADFILKDYYTQIDILNFIIILLPLVEQKENQLIQEISNEFAQKHHLFDLLRDQKFYRFTLCDSDQYYIIHQSMFNLIKPGKNENMYMSTNIGEVQIKEFSGLFEITPIDFLEIKNISLLSSFSLRDQKHSFFEANFNGPNYLLLTKEKINQTNTISLIKDEVQHEWENKMQNTDVDKIFNSFSQEVTEGEIKNILSEITDNSIIENIMERVSVDYNKIIAVFDDVGQDGLDIDIIITCLYVELKAKWIQLNLQQQYRAFKGLPTDMAVLGHASVASLFLAKIEPFLEDGFINKINTMLNEPIAA